MVFLHPGDKLLDFFSLPWSHCIGSLKQARWQRAKKRRDVVIVLSGGGDVVVKGVVAVMGGCGDSAERRGDVVVKGVAPVAIGKWRGALR